MTITIPSPTFLAATAFVLGACLGSFLNVVVARLPFGMSVVWPPSHCQCCHAAVRPLHNMPVLSWFLLRGRCHCCQSSFSVRYALVELFFGSVCGLAVIRHGLGLAAANEIILIGFLLPLALIDLDWWILPHVLTRPGIAVGLLLGLAQGKAAFFDRLLGAAVGFSALMLIGFVAERILRKEAMGRGDPWLIALIGAFLGVKSLLPVIFLSSVQGVVIGMLMIVARRRREAEAQIQSQSQGQPSSESAYDDSDNNNDEDNWQPDPTAIPFGPFLALAAAEVHYFSRISEVMFPIDRLWSLFS